MTQEQVIILCLKVGLIAGFASIAVWVAVYSGLAKWWTSSIGRTLVIEAVLIAGLFVPQILSLFFNLNRLDSRIAAWSDVALIGLVTPTMIWRTIVFLRMGTSPGRKPRHPGTAGLLPPSPQDWGEHGPS